MSTSSEPKTATIAQLGLQELSRKVDASTLPYGAFAAPGMLPRGARATVKLLVMKEKPQIRVWSLAGSGFGDEHVLKLIEVLHGSECAIKEIDFSFNARLTDTGLLQICDALAREGLAGHDLELLTFGQCGALGDAAKEAATSLFAKARPDLTLDFKAGPLVNNEENGKVTRLLQVGKVFPDSPASAAGLVRGDLIVQLGPFTFDGKERNRGFKSDAERHMDAIEYFRGVSESLKPLVQEQAAVDGEIDVIVLRGETHFIPLLFKPAKWSGEGLLGAKIGHVD